MGHTLYDIGSNLLSKVSLNAQRIASATTVTGATVDVRNAFEEGRAYVPVGLHQDLTLTVTVEESDTADGAYAINPVGGTLASAVVGGISGVNNNKLYELRLDTYKDFIRLKAVTVTAGTTPAVDIAGLFFCQKKVR